jgi:uncharacterized protein
MIEQDVVDDAVNQRFVLGSGADEAELVYRLNGRRLVLVHTGVPDALSGQGIGGRLVSAAVDRARDEGLTLVPVCPYARRWLERHLDAAAGVPIDWPPPEATGGT